MSTPSTFSGRRLESARNARRLTQHDLASKLRKRGFGTTQTTVSRWEAGQQPQSSVLPALADELGVAMAELFGDDDAEESDPVADLFSAFLRVVDHRVAERVKELAS